MRERDSRFLTVILPCAAELASLTAQSPANSPEPGQEHHLANVRQLTQGGENAEAYFSADGSRLIHQSTRSDYPCDQIYSTFVVSWSNWSLVANLIATNNDNTSPGDSGGPWSFGTIADGGHRGDQWIWFGTRNIFTRAALFPTALGVAVMI